MTKELKPGETITIECEGHGVVAEGVTLDKLSKTVEEHREMFGCIYVIHLLIASGEIRPT